jgi:putative drug exporter of the RND superfamily
VITAAAAIMVVVFIAFVASPEMFLQLFGIGLAAAILLDATVVRMVLVPAVMQLLGARNWWIPKWMERRLPRVDVEPGAVSLAKGEA